jgi:hypothetical protein
MSATNDNNSFYTNIPVFRDFGGVMEQAFYKHLPDDWTIGVSDIMQSTKAIRENRYRAVNMAGAAVIAIKNALDGGDFPYVFGGDGASFAVPPRDIERARAALAATAAWVKNEIDLVMRVALVPVATVRPARRRPRLELRLFRNHAVWNSSGRFRARDLSAASDRELRLSKIR